jgi:glycosyltransferase involved in cell wall biosynthesis
MPRRQFIFIEPSKVGSQHITLIEGYLRALTSSAVLKRSFDLTFCASNSTAAALSAATRAAVKHVPIPVMDPEKRRLVRKSCVELYVVMRCLLTMRRGDVLFVSCVLPTTLLFLEACNRLLRRRGFFVELHGEVEGLFDKSMQRPSSFGFWVLQWMRLRRHGSTLSLVVIDDFIKARLLAEFPGKLRETDIFVVHIPIVPLPFAATQPEAPAAVCFIGYRTRLKGFDQFLQLSGLVPGAEFVAIGAGKVEQVASGRSVPITGSDGYMHAIARCSVALFPYVGGYNCSLSAAAVDALSAGVYILASDRACFVSLEQYFGAEMVTVARSAPEMAALLTDERWLAEQRGAQERRLERLKASKYSLDAVRSSFETLMA